VEIVDVIQALILIFLAAEVLVRRLIRVRAPAVQTQELRTVSQTYGRPEI